MEFTELIAAVERVKVKDQTDSQSLLFWFLYNLFRLDETESADCISDRKNDKGIDAIWVDDETQEIFLFQAKYTAKEQSSIGDVDLKTFIGTAKFFENTAAFDALVAGKTDAYLINLLARQKVRSKIESGYELKLVFVSTEKKNQDTIDYLKAVDPDIQFFTVYDQSDLLACLESVTKTVHVVGTHSFTLPSGSLEYMTPEGYRMILAPVLASDIVAMQGIENRSLFELNARKHLGRTRVNKELEVSMRDKTQHGRFPMFHNGLTVICKSAGQGTNGYIEITDYTVVNGCQSVVTLYDNKRVLTSGLKILARLIEVGDNVELAKEITYRSNNQNGISVKDLRSNDRIQISLQGEVSKETNDEVFFQIKAGETTPEGATVISNEFAGQCLMAVYSGRSYNAHQKFKVFGEDYEDIFRGADAWKILFAVKMHKIASEALDASKIPSASAYALTKFVFMGCLVGVLRLFPKGVDLLKDPKSLMGQSDEKVMQALSQLASIVVSDFDRYIEERSDIEKSLIWDYKSMFKNPTEVNKIITEIRAEYEKNVKRHPEDDFGSLLTR